MRWRVTEAKQEFSQVVRAAREEPQEILNRDRPVAVVLAVESYEEYRQWRASRARPSLEEVTRELRQICREEEYALEVGERRDRENSFAPGGWSCFSVIPMCSASWPNQCRIPECWSGRGGRIG